MNSTEKGKTVVCCKLKAKHEWEQELGAMEL